MSENSKQAVAWLSADTDGSTAEGYFTDLVHYFLLGYYTIHGSCSVSWENDSVKLAWNLNSYSSLKAVYDEFGSMFKALQELAPDLRFAINVECHWEHSDDSVEDIWTELDAVRYRRSVRVSRTDVEDQFDFPEM